jgi:hypothetical protein
MKRDIHIPGFLIGRDNRLPNLASGIHIETMIDERLQDWLVICGKHQGIVSVLTDKNGRRRFSRIENKNKNLA